jgi:lipopolysaccharide transport system ATP-binding protein
MNNAIEVRGLGKRYQLGEREWYGSLRDTLIKAARSPRRWFGRDAATTQTLWALKDVSFDVREGEIIGVIGRNGSGKSTLLKILSRITEPTEGRALVRGQVGSLLEVGTGFHPELTGRENVLVNGAILGMKHREILAKFDEIVEFAEVGQFIDTPVKHYSSGMQMRLAFAVAAHLEPNILLVDEVLAVGDHAFQQKCLGKMGDVAREGRTVLFVSHDLTSVQVLCERAIRLGHGQVQGIGPASEQINAYLAESRAAAPADLDHPIRLGSDLELVRFGFSPNPVESGTHAIFDLELRSGRSMKFDEVAGFLHDSLGRLVGVIDLRQPSGPHEVRPGRNLKLRADLSAMPLVEGEYRVGTSIRSGTEHHLIWELITLDVTPRSNPEFVPYRVEIRGLVAFDFTVQSLAHESPQTLRQPDADPVLFKV